MVDTKIATFMPHSPHALHPGSDSQGYYAFSCDCTMTQYIRKGSDRHLLNPYTFYNTLLPFLAKNEMIQYKHYRKDNLFDSINAVFYDL